jgi:hypothetical protein
MLDPLLIPKNLIVHMLREIVSVAVATVFDSEAQEQLNLPIELRDSCCNFFEDLNVVQNSLNLIFRHKLNNTLKLFNTIFVGFLKNHNLEVDGEMIHAVLECNLAI